MKWQRILVVLFVLFLITSWWSHHAEARKRKQGVLAVIHISGPIRTSLSSSAWSSPDADDIAERLHAISEDKDVKAVLLRINSPGGTVGAVQEISAEIARCRANGKKIVASMGDVAASGGYYLASQADKIYADPGTITGSIGVIMEFGNLEGLLQKIGVKLEVIKSGQFKDIGSPARALTAEERRMLQASINDAYDQFVTAVSSGRKMPVEKIKPLADGRIYTGRQAKEVGLIDELGSRQDAIQAAIKLAGLPAEPAMDTDEKPSLSGFMKQISSESRTGLEALTQAAAGPQVEYRWR